MEILKIILRCVIAFFIIISATHAQNLQLQEREIQAGLLYNFMKYTSWPSEKISDGRINVCIIGSDPFDGHLQPLAERTVNRKSISVKTIKNIEEGNECHLLVIGSGKQALWDNVKNIASSHNILTVSTDSGFSDSGGMIEFGRKGNKIDVKLNVTSVKQAKLNIANRMLKLVTLVN